MFWFSIHSFMFQWDSDFDEVFQRLKSEQQWTHFPDDILRFELEVSYGAILSEFIY